MEIKNIILNGKVFQVSKERFDEDINVEHGASYHSYTYTVTSEGMNLRFKKYDDQREIGYICNEKLEETFIVALIKLIIGNIEISTINLENIFHSDNFTCPCCGYKTFDEAPGSYDICPICFWEDDPVQLRFPQIGGANINLIDAQNNFEKYGAIEKRFVANVRKSNDSDIKDPLWRKFDFDKDRLNPSQKGYFENVKFVIDKEPEYYWLKKF